jgi:hypothetical protein
MSEASGKSVASMGVLFKNELIIAMTYADRIGIAPNRAYESWLLSLGQRRLVPCQAGGKKAHLRWKFVHIWITLAYPKILAMLDLENLPISSLPS